MRKLVYFVTGTPDEVNADLRRVREPDTGALVRVVAPRNAIAPLEQLAPLDRGRILACTPLSAALVWLRLWAFLARSSGSEIVCFQSPGRFRFLKLIAWSLPGKLVFSDGKGARLSCSRIQFLRAAMAPKGAICIAGSASRELLENIVSSVRARYPGARLHGVLFSSPADVSGLFESFEHARPWVFTYLWLLRNKRFRAVVLACTNEHYPALKWMAWFLPVWRVEIYNENLDVFSGRNVRLLVRHWLWRIRQNRELQRRSLPIGVVGSASAFFLKRIVQNVRARYPGAAVHGLLPQGLEDPAQGLFDAVTVVNSGPGRSLRQCWRASRRRSQCWIVPCTDEPYGRMKLLAFLLPFARRQIYNEQADAFAARELRTLRRHIAWRLRDHLSFQILAGTRGRNALARTLNLLMYALRLFAGAGLLCRVRIRAWVRSLLPEQLADSPGRQRAVDLIYLDSPVPQPAPGPSPLARNAARIRVTTKLAGEGPDLVEKINSAIQSSQADFICLLDSRCSMLDEDWLDRLLGTFDEHTGQVGPQIVSSIDGSVIRGGLADSGRPRWNSDHSVCWRTRPDWLTIDALPWVCIVLRREAFLKAGLFREAHDGDPIRVDLDFCRRLAAHGWLSICNESVTASIPATADVAGAQTRTATLGSEPH